MFGRYQNIFRSRWNALIWAAGVLATAYCSVPSADDEDIVAKLTQGAHKPSHPPHNPWAKDSKAPSQAN